MNVGILLCVCVCVSLNALNFFNLFAWVCFKFKLILNLFSILIVLKFKNFFYRFKFTLYLLWGFNSIARKGFPFLLLLILIALIFLILLFVIVSFFCVSVFARANDFVLACVCVCACVLVCVGVRVSLNVQYE